MRQRRFLLCVLALLLFTVGVALVLGLRESDEGPEPGGPGATTPATSADRAADPRPAVRRAAPRGMEAADAPEASVQEGTGSAVIEGVVTRADTGAPVAGVTIHVTVFTVEGACVAAGYTLVTDEAGRFRDEVETGSTFLYAQGAGWVSRGLAETDGTGLRLQCRTTRCDLVVEPAARIVGRVLDAGGRPVAGAVVTTGFMRGNVGDSPNDVVTGEDGLFVLPDLVPGVGYVVRAATATCAPAEESDVSAAAGATTEIVLELPPPRSVEVLVLDAETQAPLAGVTVAARTSDEHTPQGDSSALTDSAGRALVAAMPPGPVFLEVSAPEHLPPDEVVFVEDAEDRRTGAVPRREIRLRRAASALVRVLDPDGSPLPECRVRVIAKANARVVCDEPTGFAGVTALQHLDPASRYRVEIDASATPCNAAPLVLNDWVPRHEEVRLVRGLTIEGMVVNVEGRQVAEAEVEIRDESGRHIASVECDSDGRFRVLRLVDGEFVLRAQVPGDVETAPRPETRVAAGARDVRVVLDPRASVLVRFSETVEIWEHDVAVGDVASDTWRNTPGPSGSRAWRAAGLVPGARTRIRWADWSGGRWATADFVAGKDTEISLTLVPGKPLAGQVILPDGSAADPDVVITRDGLEYDDVRIDAEGRFRFPGLAPGAWHLAAWARTDGDTVRVELDVEAGREDVVLDLRPTTK